MTKSSSKHKAPRLKCTSEHQTFKSTTVTLSDLRQDLDLWYRIRVLLYDLNNVKDHASEKRLSSTTNELYISEPYFKDHEATKIRTASVDNADQKGLSGGIPTSSQTLAVEQALHHQLENFLDKRKASGDARPCGPHDVIPVYSSIFGITKEHLRDERLVGRLARSGLGDSSGRATTEATAIRTSKDVSKRSGRKDKK